MKQRLPMFIAMDPPKHDEQRKAVSPIVAPHNLASMEGTIRERAPPRSSTSLPINEEFDWVERVSIELTTQMLATLFDFPFEDRHMLTCWSDVATSVPEVDQHRRIAGSAHGRAGQDARLLHAAVERARQRAAGNDLISMLAHNPATRNMEPLEYLGNLVLLIVGGNDTTRNSMTGGVLALNQYPDEYAKLRANPALIPSMVSEIIRWQTPLAHMRRTALQDVELGGKKIRKGDKVVMWYVSGNRDEEVIDDPERLHHRPPAPAPAPVLRLRHPPLRGQPPGRAAAEDPVGRDPEALPGDRGHGRAEAGAVELRARHQRAAGAHPGLKPGGRPCQSSRRCAGTRASVPFPCAGHSGRSAPGCAAPH